MKPQIVDGVLARTNIRAAKCRVLTMLAMAVLAADAQNVSVTGANLTATSNAAVLPAPSLIERTLGVFLEIAAQDDAVQTLLHKHKLMLQYSISDMGLTCFVGFKDGKVVSAFGRPERLPELIFLSDAVTLDKVLKGDESDSNMEVTVHLNVIRKIKLGKDLKSIRASLAKVYKSACDRVLAEGTTLVAAAKN